MDEDEDDEDKDEDEDEDEDNELDMIGMEVEGSAKEGVKVVLETVFEAVIVVIASG
jgi:hypothetical protein